MLRASRFVRPRTRGFATAVGDGVKVTAINSVKSTASVTVLLKSGSRYEPKPGAAHVLSNFAFKGNSKVSAISTIRQAELFGGVLSSTLTREHLALTAEFLPGDEAFFVDLLAANIAYPDYSAAELKELVFPSVHDEARAAANSPSTVALETAHSLAFRRGLGNSLFADADAAHSITSEDAVALHAAGVGALSVVVQGLPAAAVQELLVKALPERGNKPSQSTSSASAATKYFGGSTRIPVAHADSSAIFIGFGTANTAHIPALHALAAHLSPTPAVKWSAGSGPLGGKLPAGVRAQTAMLPYSDAALFGLLLDGSNPAELRLAAETVVNALKTTAGGVNKEEAQRAVAKAKFALVNALENPLLYQPEANSAALVDTVGSLDGTAISKVASELLKGKSTFVAVGDSTTLPYAADELGLSA